MTESRYKIEYVQSEPKTESHFRFFGALGYLWLALLASVLTYGIVYKHIPTSEIISYFQKFKTDLVKTDISSQSDTPNKTDIALFEDSIIIDTEVTAENTVELENNENTADTHKLVSEVINDNQLTEDVVFESEQVEPTTSQTQQAETKSIVNEIIKAQDKINETKVISGTTETIESATAAVEIEIEKIIETVTTTKQEPVQKEIELEEKAEKKAHLKVNKDPLTTLSDLVKNAVSTTNENDLAYLKAVTDYETNKIADSDFLEKIKSQEKKSSEKNIDNSIKKPENSSTSAVDAIIATMNADKAAKEKPPLSYQEKIQSEVNMLLKNENSAQSTSQINN